MIEKSRVQPHSIEAEEAVLGCCLTDEGYMGKAIEFMLTSEIFYSNKCKKLWEIMIDMRRKREPIDLVTVVANVPNQNKEELSAYWISNLTSNAPVASNVEYYAKIVLEKYLQRRLIHSSYKIQTMAYDNAMEFEKIISEVHRYTAELQDLQPTKDFDITQELDDAIADIHTIDNVVPYGYSKLDQLAGGMTKGEITVIAGRPGHGKTTFGVNLIRNMLKKGMKVLMVNREMTNKEMFKKFLVLESGNISYKDIRLGNMTQEDFVELDSTKERIIKKWNDKLIMHDDIKDLGEACNIIRKVKPDIVIDDYIQLVKVAGQKDRRFEIEEIMQEYKWIAKMQKIPIILLSQLNREIEKRDDPIPKTSDLAESGSIEQVAENILFVYYDWKIRYEKSHLGKNQIQIVAAKVRYGETGIARLGFDGNKCLFASSKDDVKFN